MAEYLDVPLHLMFPQPWSPTSAYPHPLSSIHDKRFYFSPTSTLKKQKQQQQSKSSSLMSKHTKEETPRDKLLAKLASFQQQGPSFTSGGGGGGGDFFASRLDGPKNGKPMTNKEFAMYYDVRLTNRLSYKVADEFVWMGLRTMTNKFRVDLQVHPYPP